MSKLAPARTADEIIGFVIHHSADLRNNANEAELRQRLAQHEYIHSRPKSWELIYTGGEYGFKWLSYHFAVAQDGFWMPTQDFHWKRYHAGDDWRGADSFNRWGIGILIEGNFEIETPSEACLEAAAEIIYKWEKEHDKKNLMVIGHKETGSTLCPGRNMGISTRASDPVRRIRELANQMHNTDIQQEFDKVTHYLKENGLDYPV